MDTKFYRTSIKLLIPMVIQNIFGAMMGSVDVIMLNSVGQTSIAAGSLATQYSMILFMFYIGIGSGAILLAAQYYGKGDMKAIAAIEGIALRFCLLISAVFSLGAIFIPSQMMRVYTTDPVIIAEGVKYLRIIWVYYIFFAISNTYFSLLRSAGRFSVSMICNGIGFFLNIILNSIFLFGLFGLPKMGIRGVAIATCISNGVCVACCFFVSFFSKDIKLKFSYMFIKSRALMKDFFKMSVPAILNDISWGIAFSVYVAIMGRLGSDVVAANSIVCVVRSFATALCYAVAAVGGIIVGNLIGANKIEEADKASVRYLWLSVIFGAIGGFLVFLAIPFILHHASLSSTSMYYLKRMLYINTYYIMGTAVNNTLIVGIFRAGGSTRFGLVCDTIDMWGYGVPIGLITAFVLKLPVVWVYFFLCLDEFVKWPWVFSFYKSRKWLKNITRDNVID